MSDLDPAHDGEPEPIRITPLDAMHRALGGRMVAFAGWSLPVQYPDGVLREHERCRTAAALFDVSHMGQVLLHGADSAAALERVLPADLLGLACGQQRYTVLLNEAGGIIDDLIVTRLAADRLLLVVNASRRDVDLAHLRAALPAAIAMDEQAGRALLAVQGPRAADAVEAVLPGSAALRFMHAVVLPFDGTDAIVARCGYTGEDGFEISVAPDRATALADRLLSDGRVGLAGLGARDSLRLEAGLPLWGNDIDELTTPIEAGLTLAIGRRRRSEGGFPGEAVIRDQLAHGPPRRRVGLRPSGRAPARAGVAVAAADGTAAGTITSGGFGPTVGGPVSMGYVRRDLATPGETLTLLIRGRPVAATVTALPFVPAGTRPRAPR